MTSTGWPTTGENADAGLDLRVGTGAEAVPADARMGRRIEDWIVDADADQAGDNRWHELIGSVGRGPRQGRRRASGGNDGAAPGGWSRFRVSQRRDVTVVSLSDRALTREHELSELSGDLTALVRAGHCRLVLDFGAVERMSSWVVAVVGAACRDCRGAGGALYVCGLRPGLAVIFGLTGLAREVPVLPDSNAALGADWPRPPRFRELPVELLAALVGGADSAATVSLPAGDGRPRRGLGDEVVPVEGVDDMTNVSLVVADGPWKGRSIALSGDRFVNGRGSGCQLRPASASVSRAHAEFERRGVSLILRDLGSRNGTRLNDRLLRGEEREVHDGDLVEVGGLVLRVAALPAPRAARGVEDQVAGWLVDRPKPGTEPQPAAATADDLPGLDGGVGDSGLKYRVIEGVLIVTPLTDEFEGGGATDALRSQLNDLLDLPLPRQVVVDLTHVGWISGQAIGVLVAHFLRLDRTGGSLRLCGMNPRVAAVLEQVRLGMLVPCYPTVDDAVLEPWSRVSVARESGLPLSSAD